MKVLTKLHGDFKGRLTREKWIQLIGALSRMARRDIDALIELGILVQEETADS